MDDRGSDSRGEPEGTQLGVGAEERDGTEAAAAPALRNLPIVEKDGIKFYEVKRYGRNNSWVEYQPVDGDWSGSGTVDISSPTVRAKAALAREAALDRKVEYARSYEERVYGQLERVADLQAFIVSAALDAGTELDRAEMEKLRLGLQAAESILNRALGKAVTKIDADVRHTTSDEISIAEAEWVEEED